MMTKICKGCGEQPLINFSPRKTGSKDGYNNYCKVCINEKRKNYLANWFKNLPTEKKIKRNDTNRKYKENNKNKLQEQYRDYYTKNKHIINKRKNLAAIERRKKDVVYKIKCRLRSMVWEALTKNNYTKKSKTFEILGCTADEFKIYLESKFEPWMTWDNYGKYKKDTYNYGWDIDHIKPLSSDNTEEGVIALNHYTNLQPLCSKINRDKKKNILN